VGEADAVELLSQWEGFARFCREALRVEPLVLLLALGLGHGDPAAEVRAAYPDAAVDEAEVAVVSAVDARMGAALHGAALRSPLPSGDVLRLFLPATTRPNGRAR
jgi:hypothetical protein